MELNQNSLAKGFLTKEWKQTQNKWLLSTGSKDTNNTMEKWTKETTEALHEYTTNMWKERNETIHGTSQKESIEAKKNICRKQIKELYKLSRKQLSTKQKSYFKVPLRLRLKMSLDAMNNWIEIVETSFQQVEEKQTGLKAWLFPKQKEWVDKYKVR